MEEKRGDGNIPTLHVKEESIPEAWENSIVELYNNGLWWHRQGPKDKGRLTLDSTMMIEITNPDSDLIMHKYMTCGIEDLFEYQMEILGAKDSWVDTTGRTTKWPYHYHERFESYPGTKEFVNQIEKIIEKISKEHWKRNSQMITWVPEKDLDLTDPPCLQRVWAMIVPDERNNSFKLNLNYHFRSRNVMIASPMNMVGLWTLQSYIRDEVIENSGINLKNGRLVDLTDSYHVSAQDQPILQNFIKMLEKSKEKGEIIYDRCLNKKFLFGDMNKTTIEDKIINQTRKEISERGEEYKLEDEIKKIRNISQIVSKINGF